VQSPEEALAALRHPEIRHIQLPFNILDWRWEEGGTVAAIRNRKNVTVHARSVFLQGILAARDPAVWPVLQDVDASGLVAWLDGAAQREGRESAADLCLAFARGQDWIDGVVVGQETMEQLDVNLRLAARAPLSVESRVRILRTRPRVPAPLLDPAQWPR
jgi:spore coat polysaccharide biosynthesis protein SpsF